MRGKHPRGHSTRFARAVLSLQLFVSAYSSSLWAQAVSSPGPKLEFDVASVKQNKTNNQPNSNVPLGIGDIYTPTGGYFSATGFPFITYIVFAYKITNSQVQFLLPQLPGWATTDRFDIQARAPGNPTKDQLRTMMQAVLADRFKLTIHHETREVPIFALVLSRPGSLGPQLQQHPDSSSCNSEPSVNSDSAPPPKTVSALRVPCGGMTFLPPAAPGRVRIGARSLTMAFISGSNNLMGNLDRPVLDRTGLSGTFDFLLEYAPERRGPAPPRPESEPDDPGPTFQQALREQLGLKLESQRGAVDVLVIDRVERPSEN